MRPPRKLTWTRLAPRVWVTEEQYDDVPDWQIEKQKGNDGQFILWHRTSARPTPHPTLAAAKEYASA